MDYKLFLDDVRNVGDVYKKMSNDDFIVVRTYDEFVSCIKDNGLPDFISFDNDLGLDAFGNTALDGYAAAKWLVYESNLDLRSLKFNVHSANPVATIQIESLLKNYIEFLAEKDINEED